MVLANKKIAEAVRQEARQASIRDKVLIEYLSSSSDEHRAQIERASRQGLDPMAWLNALSVPSAFAIDGNQPSERLLCEVFMQCELEPSNPRHWRILVDALVNQCFRTAGAPQKWTEVQLFNLLCDIREVQKRSPKMKGNAQLAKLLSSKQPYKEKYSKYDGNTLRKLVGRALNPVSNPTAGIADDVDFITARAVRAKRVLGLPTELGVLLQIRLLEKDAFDRARKYLEVRHRDTGREFTEDDWLAYLPHVQKIVDAEVESFRKATPK